MGKILALFLIAYFGLYLYRRWQVNKINKNNPIGKIKYYEQELASKENEEENIIDIDNEDDEPQPPKYLH